MLSRNQKYVAGVILAYIPMVILNFLSTGTKLLNNTDNAIISNANPTYVTPDGATFSIWGFIYLFETIAVVYQALPKNHDDERLVAFRPWMILAFALNSSWLVLFAYYKWWLSTLVMLMYLGALIGGYRALEVDYGAEELKKRNKDSSFTEPASVLQKILVFTGFSMNMAWISVASGVSVTFVLRREGWMNELGVGGSPDWATLWIVIFGAVSCYLALTRGDIPHVFVTVWALGGIYRMQTVENAERFPIAAMSNVVADWAVAGMIIVSVIGVIGLLNAIYETCYLRKHNIGGGRVGEIV